MDEIRRDPETLAREILGGAVLEPEDAGDILEGATAIADALITDPTVTPAGIQASTSFLRTCLGNYEAVQADRKRFPGIAKVEVQRPWVVLGVPRGGTTFLHALLAQDPANRSPSTWETAYASPPPDNASYGEDPRIRRWAEESGGSEAGVFRAVHDKEVMKRHMIGARLPQECGMMMMPVMRDLHIWAMTRIQRYWTWYFEADQRPAYRFHHQWIQHMQWRAGRERWVLKCPTHALNLPALMAQYPDACIIQTHRAPTGSLSSLASLIGNYRRANCREVDPHAIGLEMLQMVKAHTDRPMAYRKANPGLRIIDLAHREIIADPIGAVQRIYTAFGTELPPEAEARMRAFVAKNPEGAHGAHQHDLANFGLNAEYVRDVLSDYYEAFGGLI